MLNFFRVRHLERALESLQDRVQQLESQRTVYQLERDHLLGLVSAGENRMRAMLNRASKVATPGHVSGDQSDASAMLEKEREREKRLDAALLAAKPRRINA